MINFMNEPLITAKKDEMGWALYEGYDSFMYLNNETMSELDPCRLQIRIQDEIDKLYMFKAYVETFIVKKERGIKKGKGVT